MVKLILLMVICALAGFIFFLTRKILRLKIKIAPNEPKEPELFNQRREVYKNCKDLIQYAREQEQLFKMEEKRLNNLNEMQIEKDKKMHEYEMKKYEFTQSIELYNLLCCLIESSPYLANNLKKHAREESVIILKNAANLTPEQYNNHRTMLFQVVDTVQHQQLQPANPALYKEAN